jgi:lipopolysaccharide/colanic/teichoic acid biosynthesis glycosyltransferase
MSESSLGTRGPLAASATPSRDGSRLDSALKRALDVVVSSSLLVLLLPVWVLFSVAIKLESPGPVFYRARRVGWRGRSVRVLKFRKMHNGATGTALTGKVDPRFTRLGRLLARTKLDEVPQLLNVLRGEMSLVGPRPPLSSEVDRYADDVHRRLLVRPGLTGLWQVSGRSGLSWDESVRLDLYYVDNWSMTSDLVIIAKTVRAVVGSSGAY